MVRFGLRRKIGFVWYFFYLLLFQFGAQGAEAFEFLDCAAVLAFGLGLIAQEESPCVGLLVHLVEAFAESEVAVLAAGDLNVAIAGHLRVHGMYGVAAGVEGLVEAGGEEAGLQACGADEGHLAGGGALEGEEFLGVDGMVEIEEVATEVVDFIELFETDDGEEGAGEAVLAGVLS